MIVVCVHAFSERRKKKTLSKLNQPCSTIVDRQACKPIYYVSEWEGEKAQGLFVFLTAWKQ